MLKRCAGRLMGVLMLVCVAAPALRAQASPPSAEMDRSMRRYFEGELDEAAAFLGVGVGTAFVAGSFIPRGDFGVGFAAAVLPVSAIEIVAGLVLLARTPSQVDELSALHARDPSAYRAEEHPRMQAVNFWFDVYLGIEIGLIAVGAASIVFGGVDDRSGFVGAGIGLAAQAGAMLTFDLVAAERADKYTARIDALSSSVRAVVSPALVGVAGDF